MNARESKRACPLCGLPMEGVLYKRKTGYRFQCNGKGSSGIGEPHPTVTVYVNFTMRGEKAQDLTEIAPLSLAGRARGLLERVQRLSGKGDA